MSPRLSGFAFPFRILDGRVARSTDHEKVKQNLRHLLGTRLRERPMLRSYGGGVHHRLQSANDGTLQALVRHEIELALRQYFPEVRLTTPLQLESRAGELHVSVEYVADPRDVVHRLELQVA